jgi:hypothetical protein
MITAQNDRGALRRVGPRARPSSGSVARGTKCSELDCRFALQQEVTAGVVLEILD